MKLTTTYIHPKGWEFEIEEDEALGFYLWIYKDEETMDYLQDTLAIAQLQAFEDFGIPMDSWIVTPPAS